MGTGRNTSAPRSGGSTLAAIPSEGAPIEVWSVSLHDWARGFAVHDVSDAGIAVRRLSDDEVLPERFDPDRIRAAAGSPRTPGWH